MRTAVSLALVAGIVATATPASAAVDACAAASVGNHQRGTCIFVATSGTYHLDVLSTSRYAWSAVACDKGDSASVGVWDTEGGYAATSVVFTSGGICTLTVASGGPSAANPAVPSAAVGTIRIVRP